MKHFNRAAAILVCLFIIAAPFTRCFYSYADTTTDNWQNVTTNEELAEAFRYYCKSRDLTIEGSIADGVTSFTTMTFNNICNAIGYDMTALQAHLKKETDGSNIRYLFDSTGITAYNAIFAQFLQDNNLSVGDTADQQNNTLYDGFTYVDDDGNVCLVWVLNNLGNGGGSSDTFWKNAIDQKGTYLKYQPIDIYTAVNLANPTTFTINANHNAYRFSAYKVNGMATSRNDYQYIGRIFYANNGVDSGNGYRNVNGEGGAIAYVLADDKTKLRIGLAQHAEYFDSYHNSIWYSYYLNYLDTTNIYPSMPQCVIYLTTNNTTINNNVYEGDTIINNNGTPDVDEPSGGTPPDWDLGGGQGTADDGNGNTWNITWPDFQLPDLNIDWSINGLSEKFPFSIPFDLVSLVQVLSAEPEAPEFTGTVDLKVYQWNYDLDFSQFDTVAAVFRTAETLLFVFGLIMITRKIIRG